MNIRLYCVVFTGEGGSMVRGLRREVGGGGGVSGRARGGRKASAGWAEARGDCISGRALYNQLRSNYF